MLIDHNLRPRPPWSPPAPLLAANGRRGAAFLPREHVATTHMLCSRFAAITSDLVLVYVCRDCGAREPCRDQERTDDGEEGESATFPQTASLFLRKIQRGEGTQNPQMMTTPMLTWNPEWNQTTHLDSASGGAGKANVLASANPLPSPALGGVVTYLDSTQQYFTTWSAYAALISYVRDDQMRKR